MASERRSRAEHQIANRRSGGYDVTHEVAEHRDKMPHAEAQRHPCDSGASGTAVAGLAATRTIRIFIFRQFRKSAPGEHLNALERCERIRSHLTFKYDIIYTVRSRRSRIQLNKASAILAER